MRMMARGYGIAMDAVTSPTSSKKQGVSHYVLALAPAYARWLERREA